METSIQLSPTEFISVVNQTLEYAYSSVLLVGIKAEAQPALTGTTET